MQTRSTLLFQLLIMMCFLTAAQAQIAPKVTGELTATRDAAVNGVTAISGLTVFNQNRLKTAPRGVAVVSLGKRGRIELGAETEFTLALAANNVGGELRTGRTMLSAPAGVALTVTTPQSQIVTDGKRPAVLSVELGKERALVTAYQGEANIVTGGKIERVAAGEEVSFNPQTRSWQHRMLWLGGLSGAGAAGAGIISAANPVRTVTPNLVNAKTATTAELINGSARYILEHVIPTKPPSTSFYEIRTMTCIDFDTPICRRRSNPLP